MNDSSDSQLLSAYSEHRSEAAFAELVRRHVDLVYSAAVRVVRDAHLAQDVTQAVFIALSRSAAPLAGRPSISGWLHCTTRNSAAQLVRTIERRRANEREAVAMNELNSGDNDTLWEQIAPHLDNALGELNDADREAVLLRYFQNRDFRTVGRALGISDDTAQKRVSRAVERLREMFAKRGINVGASGLVAVVSANAVQAAPVGLAVTISTATTLLGTSIVTTATATATKAIAMTTLQKTLVTTALVAAIGTGIYEAHQASLLRNQIQLLRQQQAALSEQALQTTAPTLLPQLPTNAASKHFNWESVESTDYRQYIANLRSVGCPEETIRDIVRADVNKLYEEKKKGIRNAAPRFEYWRGEDFIRNGAGREAWIKMFAVNEERDATLRALGIEPDSSKKEAKNAMFMDWWLDYLGDEKKAKVLRLHRELEDRLAVRERGSLDIVQIQQSLKQQDEAAKGLLTPDEAFQYDLRKQTGTAATVRRSLAGMEPTEQEFIAVFKIRREFEERHPDIFSEIQTVNPAELTAAERRALRETAKQVEDQIKEQIRLAFGPERYADFEMAKNPTYQEMWLLARDVDLGMLEAKQLYQARLMAEERAQRIKDDQGITVDQRNPSLATIREETEQMLQSVLREKGWKQFNRTGNKRWLDAIYQTASPNTGAPPR